MPTSSQRLARVFALGITLVVLATAFEGRAAAQTVIVRHAPAGALVQAQIDSAPPRTATADASGQASITLALPADTAETVTLLFVDNCGNEIDVRLLSPGAAPPQPAAGCTRSDAGAQFVLRPVTTFVIDVGGSGASVRMRQGPPFAAWLVDSPEGVGTAPGGVAIGSAPHAGLLAYAGGGIASYSNAASRLCGDAICSGNRFKIGTEAGVAVWATPFFGVEAAYRKPTQLSVSGSGTGFNFDSTLDSRLFLLAVNAGGRTGNLRVYGKGGANYHEAAFTQTEQTADGTQTLFYETKGWGWLVGGGFEAWIQSRLAVYVEGEYLAIRGDATSGEGVTDDHLISAIAGLRLRVF